MNAVHTTDSIASVYMPNPGTQRDRGVAPCMEPTASGGYSYPESGPIYASHSTKQPRYNVNSALYRCCRVRTEWISLWSET